ncbi:uncharacterized protein LOC142353089 [Convolutriloba macropyga]|uniref:uncharacterized protein LOC142353089 n=1 Tax=Convolutriloba macropyga TaxID=536237 RepID=UPI003F51CA8B
MEFYLKLLQLTTSDHGDTFAVIIRSSVKNDTGRVVSTDEWFEHKTDYYYHFTTEGARSDILRERQINPSVPYFGRSLGKGVYVTNLVPTLNSKDNLRYHLFKNGNSPIVRSKLGAFVALHKNDLSLMPVVPYPDGREAQKLHTSDPISLNEVRHFSAELAWISSKYPQCTNDHFA